MPGASATLVGQQVGAYRIESVLGSGGMGEVYRATDTTLGRAVAIKLLPQALAFDPERRARLEREAKTLAATLKSAPLRPRAVRKAIPAALERIGGLQVLWPPRA